MELRLIYRRRKIQQILPCPQLCETRCTKPQIDGLLKRRDQILALAKKQAAQKDESAVLYP